MKLDLAFLRQMHPLLPESTAREYGHRAALGLERRGHGSGVVMQVLFDRNSSCAELHWTSPLADDYRQLDSLRVTEDAAEGVALALVAVSRNWVVRRRLQRGEFADWLLADAEQRPVALEISGLDRDISGRRLLEKKEQVSRSRDVVIRAACVVELAIPRATVECVGEEYEH